MSLDTQVHGSPDECRVAARRLRRLAATISDAGRFLVAQSRIGSDDFAGWTAAAYRTRAARLAHQADDDGADTAALGRALEQLATGLDRVGDVMRRARAIGAARLAVDGPIIVQPGAYADDDQRQLYRRLADIVDAARAVEERLQDDYHRAVSAAAGVPPPPLPRSPVFGQVPLPPGVVAPDPALPGLAPLGPDRLPPTDESPAADPPPRQQLAPAPAGHGQAVTAAVAQEPGPSATPAAEHPTPRFAATYAPIPPTLVGVEQALTAIELGPTTIWGASHGPR